MLQEICLCSIPPSPSYNHTPIKVLLTQQIPEYLIHEVIFVLNSENDWKYRCKGCFELMSHFSGWDSVIFPPE